MQNLKFRSNASLALYGTRRTRRYWWLTPVLAFAAGGLYAALNLEQTAALPGDSTPYAVTVPLELPSIPSATGTGKQGPPATFPPAQSVAKPAVPQGHVSAADKASSLFNVSPAVQSAILLSTSIPESSVPVDAGRWLVHEIHAGENLARIFKKFGLSPQLLYRIVNSGDPAKQLNCIKPGQTLRIHLDGKDRFTELAYQIDPARKLRVSQDGEELTATLVELQPKTRIAEASGVIESSLFESAQKAGLSDTLTMQLAGIFGWDIDFALEIRSGDLFSVVFQEDWLDGSKLADGPILAAEFVNQGKVYRAVLFEDASGKTDYYTPDGMRMRKTFLRTPVKYSRISSGFTKRRWHPVLKRWRSHKGVDYAAPTGTPVKAAGDGKVAFIGRKGGYGKVIFLRHRGKYTTVYGHLSRFAKGLKPGKQVRQGQLIGHVGKTGLATGPHLHYEFRVNGKHRNPLKVTLPPPAPIAEKYAKAFKKTLKPLLVKLDSLKRTMVADAL